MNLEQTLGIIRPIDLNAEKEAQSRCNRILKPVGSLGRLEEHLIRIAGMMGTADVCTSPRAVAVFCADNGVVQEGYIGMDPGLTARVAGNLTRGDTSVCHFAQRVGADVYPVDVGIAAEFAAEGLIRRKVAYGTSNLATHHAMTREQALQAIEVGVDMAIDLTTKGYRMLAAGEMGIGNTTTSAAVASVLLDLPADRVTGRGSGLSDAGLEGKIRLISGAIEQWKPDPDDPLDVLCKVGGLDIAAMAGFYLGAAACRVPAVLDGVISGAAALLACGLNPNVRDYLLPSHVSAEPAGGLILERLGMEALLRADMRLGEGTGAVATFPLYDMMESVYHGMPTFSGDEHLPPVGTPI